MSNRNIEIKVRLNRKEAEALNKRVKKCRLSREGYLRHLINGEVPREAPPPQYFEFMRELHNVGNNLNQVAQKAHVLNAVSIQARIDKANSRLTNLIAMRADGEISKEEYQSMRSPIDAEIKELQKALDDTPTEKCSPRGLDLEGIRSTLNSLIDFSGATLSHDVINKFVYMVTPTSDTSFHWYVNLSGNTQARATYTVEGRKKKNVIKLEEIEKISSLHRKENEDNAHLIKNPIVFTFLHRLHLDKQGVLEKSEDLLEIVLSWEFRINFETAKAFRKSGGNYLRAKQWEDLTVEVRVS